MNAPGESGDALRIVTLNLQQGGRPRIAKLAARLLGYDAEVLVLTEFQQQKSAALVRNLEAAGYAVAHPVGVDPTLNTVAVASRQPITGVRPFSRRSIRGICCASRRPGSGCAPPTCRCRLRCGCRTWRRWPPTAGPGASS